MPWIPLPSGLFGASADTPGVDANLVWADGSGFVDFRRRGGVKPVTMVVVIVRMKPGRTVLELKTELQAHSGGRVPPIYPDDAQHCTAFFSDTYCRAVLANPPTLGDMIERFDMQMSVIPNRALPLALPPAPEPAPLRPTAATDLLGVIDVGCAFAHRELRNAAGTGTRVLSLWDQDWLSPLRYPAPEFGYGREVYRDLMDVCMALHVTDGAIDEEACYRTLRMTEVLGSFSHGTSVLSLLAGKRSLGSRVSADPERNPSWGPSQDRASQADIVFVQLPRDSNQDSSSAALAGQVLDGLRYIQARATPATARIVVNISTGASRHTHDGQAILETAMDELLQKDPRLHIVFSAGNSYDEMRHAVIDPMLKGASRVLTLQVPPGNETASYVVVRFDSGSQLKLRLTVPGGQPAAGDFVAMGEAKVWPDSNAPLAAVVVPRPLPGLAGSALVVLAPTQGEERSVVSGRWQLEVMAEADIPTPIHLHITRNQVNPGALPRSRQMRFVDVDETYHPNRYLRLEHDDANSPGSPIRRLGTLSSLATRPEDQRLWVVGSYRLRDVKPSAYSSAGPAAGIAAARRNGPDVSGATDESTSMPGIRAAGTLSGMTVRVKGTSFAAPQVSRELFNNGALNGLQGPLVLHRNGNGNLPP